ncbi:CPBP family intramembrane glutamic endopeptidase [Laceyella putida]|uniref:CPBP family intramembrane glutamic endopeptidase n=1 Tax=Laceyella putida TaxID=110101 RepID=A0ABW2RPI6_9BACL
MKILELVGKGFLLFVFVMLYSLPIVWITKNEGINLAWQNIAFILAVFSLYGLFERRRGWNLGLRQAHRLRQFAKGAGFGIAMISVVALIIFATHGIMFEDVHVSPVVMTSALQSLGLFLLVGLSEETASRGYVQGLLRYRYNKRTARIVSALLFALLHGLNPGVWNHVLPIINLFLAGLFFSVYRDVSGGLWAPIGFHFTWNFFQGPVYGFKVSGLQLHSIVESRPRGAAFLSGGAFGAEGSVVCTGVLLAALCWLIWRDHKKETVASS